MARRAAKTITVTGVPDIARRIRRIGDPKRTNKIVNDSLKFALRPMASVIRANAPKDSGVMALAVRIRKGKRSRKGPSYTIAIYRKDLGKMADAKGYYPAAVEYGSKRQEAQPFMQPAFDGGKASTRDAAIKRIREQILKA